MSPAVCVTAASGSRLGLSASLDGAGYCSLPRRGSVMLASSTVPEPVELIEADSRLLKYGGGNRFEVAIDARSERPPAKSTFTAAVGAMLASLARTEKV